MTDLSIEFDCILYDLLIAKLEAYGFQIDALKLVYDYLLYRKQRAKINEAFSSWKNIEYGVSQGSILGPRLFDIQLCDLFYIFEDLDTASYADDATICAVKKKKQSVIDESEKLSLLLFKWFNDNFIKANIKKKVYFFRAAMNQLQ